MKARRLSNFTATHFRPIRPSKDQPYVDRVAREKTGKQRKKKGKRKKGRKERGGKKTFPRTPDRENDPAGGPAAAPVKYGDL
ncbi:glutaminehypothetical protein-fructose-6-phosphate transaminase (isomerizing) [Sarotherodon galilaeus]